MAIIFTNFRSINITASHMGAREQAFILTRKFVITLLYQNIVSQDHSVKCSLTHCGLVTPHGTEIWANIASGNGLLPDGTKPLPEPMLNFEMPQPSITKICLKITCLTFRSYFPRANELTRGPTGMTHKLSTWFCCFGYIIIYPYSSRLLYWGRDSHITDIVSVPVNLSWRIW